MNELPLYDIDIYGSWETFIEFWELMEKPIIIYENEKYQNPEEIIEYQIYYIKKNNFVSGMLFEDILDDNSDEMIKLKVWDYGIVKEHDFAYVDMISNIYDDKIKINTYQIDVYDYYSSDGEFEIDWLKNKSLEDVYYISLKDLIGTPQEELITLAYNKLKE